MAIPTTHIPAAEPSPEEIKRIVVETTYMSMAAAYATFVRWTELSEPLVYQYPGGEAASDDALRLWSAQAKPELDR